jgi:beta-fructofuranosidase
MMKSLTSLGAAILAATPVALAQDGYGSNGGDSQCLSIDADEIRAMGNNSLFTRWRPYSHVNAPAGWLNDPCAPMYDPTRDEYHIFYQFHPNHINW